jgi:hypothetical protein
LRDSRYSTVLSEWLRLRKPSGPYVGMPGILTFREGTETPAWTTAGNLAGPANADPQADGF